MKTFYVFGTETFTELDYFIFSFLGSKQNDSSTSMKCFYLNVNTNEVGTSGFVIKTDGMIPSFDISFS
jgi:hypothetical protein